MSRRNAVTSADAAVQQRRSPARRGGVHVYTMDDRPWRELPRQGVKEKAVRRDANTGHYLGLLAFEPMARTGLHQHLGTALTYFLSGALTDYQGSASEGMLGVNLAGTTHDAVSYTGCLLAARLEGPVVVPEGQAAAHPIHGGATAGVIRNPNPKRPPDINIAVEPLAPVATRFAGVGRRAVYDYAGTGDERRVAALSFRPHAPAIEVMHSAPVDWYILGGDLKIGGRRAGAGSFAVIEPGARVEISSEYGCFALCWAEGPAWGEAGKARAELYGF